MSKIINGGFESKCRNRANARNSHHPQADFIIAGRAFDPLLQREIVLVNRKARVLQRQSCLRQYLIGCDQRAHEVI
ncbi:hypothetical protein [Falsiphaeobacter marinintestinus]|uniref:hypothetical protein n=1 Tax=Falsiphaeobacter marinintestinus TaxID=1492905 RepID=UPI001FE5BECE|nr:hypothetical protein [Phaeobacter marinintestinus]